MFTDIAGRAACLICGDDVAAMWLKEHNLKQHYKTNHWDK